MTRPRLMVLSGGTARDATPASAPTESPDTGGSVRTQLSRVAATVALAAALCAVGFVTHGGVDETIASGVNTWTEIALTVVGAVAIGTGVLLRPDGERRHGWLTAGLMGLLFAVTAGSIAWSVAPDSSWLASGQMLAYLAVFAGAILLARPLRRGWSVVLGALTLWAVALCGWSLLAKTFPATLASANQIGRLQAPFGYWNAIALAAAMGVPCCLWLGARRVGGRRVAGLAVPALSLLIAVLVLSYSRSADLAAIVAAAVWIAWVPLRLRAIAMLAAGALGGAVISVWALTHHGITGNNVAIAAQDHAGHTFGLVIAVVLVLGAVVGLALAQTMDSVTVAEPTRRRIGGVLCAGVGVVVLAGIGAVAASSRGLTGEISYRWHELVNPQATVSATSASRVLQFGSSRPLYWHEALFVGDRHWFKGVGELGYSVARLLDPQSLETVFQAHSYVFETYADLGVVGLAITAALLGSWLIASGRTLAAPSADIRETGERPALLTLAVLVLAFGVQGTLDWTWYFTGLTVPALLAAGWLAGRGPRVVAPSLRNRSILDQPARLVMIPLLLAVVLLGGWLIWRPLHSAQLVNRAENTGSLQAARSAQSADPIAFAPYQILSDFQLALHSPSAAESELMRATREQPHNPQVWLSLAQYEISRHQWRPALLALHQVQILNRPQNDIAQTADTLINEAYRHLPKS